MNKSFMTCIIGIVEKLGGINMTVSVQTQKIKNFIGGKWVDANTAEYHDVPNPATGKSLAQVPISTSEDVNAAVKAAKEEIGRASCRERVKHADGGRAGEQKRGRRERST